MSDEKCAICGSRVDCVTDCEIEGCPLSRERVDFGDEGVYMIEIAVPEREEAYGWICPVCGAGNSPWNPVCPCVDSDERFEIDISEEGTNEHN